MILKIGYDTVKLQKSRIWRHQNDVTKIFHF